MLSKVYAHPQHTPKQAFLYVYATKNYDMELPYAAAMGKCLYITLSS